jgi:hypothetical protein
MADVQSCDSRLTFRGPIARSALDTLPAQSSFSDAIAAELDLACRSLIRQYRERGEKKSREKMRAAKARLPVFLGCWHAP